MKAVVIACGAIEPDDAAWLDAADLVIAADGGAGSLHRIGGRPDILIGDMDSVDPSLLAQLEAAGTEVDRHPADKDSSDTELALGAAVEAGASAVVVIGAMGGDRMDHELANLLLLAAPSHAGRDLLLARGGTGVRALHAGRRLTLAGSPGDTVTLLPVGGTAIGVSTDGLRWPLHAATLRLGSSRGLSNEVVEAPASVRVDDGTLLVVETAAGAAS